MTKLSVETTDREKPIILFYGKNTLIHELIKKNEKDFKIAYVSDDETQSEGKENFYRIKKSSIDLIEKLEEKIDYSVIYLNATETEIDPLYEKLYSDNTKTIILIDLKKANDFYDLINKYKNRSNMHFMFLGDIYAEEGEYLNTEIAKFVQDGVLKKTINLTGNDTSPIFPIHISDSLAGIGQVLFTNLKHKSYYLFYKHPLTLISAAHVISKAEPDLEIKYGEPEKKEHLERSFDDYDKKIKENIYEEPHFLDKYLRGFEKTLLFFENSKPYIEVNKETEVKKVVKEVIPKKVLPKKSHLSVFTKAIFSAFVLFILFNALFITIALFQLKNAAEAFEKSDYQKVSGNINSAKMLIEITSPTADFLSHAIGLIGMDEVRLNYLLAKDGINFLSTAGSDFEVLQNLTAGIDRETLDKLIADATYIYFQSVEKKSTHDNKVLNAIVTPDLSKIASIAQIAPEILGYSEEKNYLILFQNNGELRPTGGFIGSVGKIKFRGGKMEEFNIQDVYEYDGQLTAHVEPHYIIRRYLQPHLYLRDSNFDPDFQESAKAALQIYKLETEKEVDGIIAINFDAVRQFIREIGPLTLPSYDKTLDENNTFEFLQTTIDDNFFPGSAAKKEVLEALFNQITLRLEDDRTAFIKIARLIPKLMNEKNIIFSFNNQAVQAAFLANNFGGEILDKRINSGINDFLAINEANIGVNKANINVLRETVYDGHILAGEIISKVTHTIFNNDEKAYKTYIRFIVPRESDLTSIIIDGEQQEITAAIEDFRIYEAPGFKAPSGLEVDSGIIFNHQVFGFIVDVAPDSKKTIEVSYENGVRIPVDEVLTYSLLFLKQPGTSEFPFTLNLNYGGDFTIKEVENAKLNENSITITSKIATDREFDIELLKR